MVTSPPDSPLDSEGRYRIVRMLGKGGMASVFEVVDTRSPNSDTVAAKVASSDPHNRERSWERLQREYEVARSITSAHTPRVLETGVTAHNTPFYTMELIPGCTLDDFIKGHDAGTIPPESQVLAILKQVASGLNAVHQAGFVFADLKPANIIVDLSTPEIKTTLIDFGISCASVPFSSDQKLLESIGPGMTGTSLYMSPEQILGVPLTVRSDIFSFGILAYQLCTGHLPVTGDHLFKVSATHLIGRAIPARAHNPAISRDIERMIQICMEKQPGNRYESMDEVLARLDAAGNASGTRSLWSSISRIFGS